jgi:hypothetical protein
MASTIQLKRGSGAPTSGDLAAGELGLDLTNRVIYSSSNGSDVIKMGAASLDDLGITATAAELNKLDGVTATTAELNYVNDMVINSASPYNTFVGNNSGISATGTFNTGLGIQSLYQNIGGTLNTAVGSRAGYAITSGSSNVSVGSDSLFTNITGSSNVAVGKQALYSTTASQNVAVGTQALYATTSGSANVAIGEQAGSSITTGSNNINIGLFSEPTSATTSDEITLGNSFHTNLRCNDTTISSLSDGRDKTDIVDSPYGLDTVKALKPRQFKWQTRDGNGKDGTTRLGFIAQELLEVGDNDVLDLVYTANPEKLEAKYGNLIPVLVKAIQELTAKVEALENA